MIIHTDKALNLYAYFYYDILNLCNATEVWKNITIKELSPSRGSLQRAYAEMNELEFPGKVIDFFSYVGMVFIVRRAWELFNDYREEFDTLEKLGAFVRADMIVESIACNSAERLFFKDENWLLYTLRTCSEVFCDKKYEDETIKNTIIYKALHKNFVLSCKETFELYTKHVPGYNQDESIIPTTYAPAKEPVS